MLNTRKIRFLGLATFIIVLIFVLIRSNKDDSLTSDTINSTNPKLENIIIDDTPKISSKIDEIDESKVKEIEESKQQLNKANDDLTTGKGSTFDPAKEYKEILSMAPIIIFSKSFCPYSKSLKSLLHNDYDITPQPLIVELDKHKNGKALQEYIGEQTGRSTVPNLFVGGKSRGGSDEMAKLHREGLLLENLQTWGGKNIQVSKINAPSNS